MSITINRALEALKEVLAELGFNDQHEITMKGPNATIELAGDEIAENIIYVLNDELKK